MSRRPGRRAIRAARLAGGVLWAAALAAPAAGAQESPIPRAEREARLEADVARERALWHALDARARVADSLAAEARLAAAGRVPLDTVAAGPVRVVTPADQAGRTRALWRRAWTLYAPAARPGSGPEGRLFGFQWDTRADLGLPAGAIGLRSGSPWLPASRALDGAVGALAAAGADDLPADLRRWLAGAAPAPPDWEAVRRAVALAGTEAAGRCLEGQAAACWSVLGAVGAGGRGDLVDALAPREARALVEARPTPEGLPWRRCLREGDDGACREVLRADAPLEDLVAAGPPARAALLWTALAAGDGGAPLAAAPPPGPAPGQELLDLRTRVAEASGGDPEGVMATWMAAVTAVEPDPHADLAGSRALAVLWMLAFAILATRSTRWRFP